MADLDPHPGPTPQARLEAVLAADTVEAAVAFGLDALVPSKSSPAALFVIEDGEIRLDFWHGPVDLPAALPFRGRARERTLELARAARRAGLAPPCEGSESELRMIPLSAFGRLLGVVCLEKSGFDPAQAELERLVIAALSWRFAAHQERDHSRAQRQRYERWFHTLDEQIRTLDLERQKFSALVHSSDAVVFTADLQRTIRWTNGTMAEKLVPEKGSSWLGKSCQAVCSRFSSTSPGPCDDCPVGRALDANQVVHREFRHPDGPTTENFYLTAVPIKGPDGRPREAMVMIQDLSGLDVLRQSEARFREAESRLRTVISNAPVLLFAVDRDGMFTMWEGRALETLGLSSQQIVGRSALDLTGAFPQIVEDLRRALTGEEFSDVLEVGPVWFETRYTPLRDESDAVIGVIGVATDISERRDLEEQLRHAQRMEAIGRLAGGVAHDFNNLLAAILGHSELMLRRLPSGDPLRREADEIHQAGLRGAMLTRQLLAFSRKEVIAPRTLDLNRVVAGMDGMLRRLIGEHIELVTVTTAETCHVCVDLGGIEQVVLNLAVNARDAMPQGGRLTLAVAPAPPGDVPDGGAWVLLRVTDTGVGMDAETLAHAFEPFYTTKRRGRGTGLGLATVYGIVQRSGGFVRAASEPGVGSTFAVFIPQALDHPIPDETNGSRPSGSLPSETVLLVEDEDAVRRMARELLEERGYTVLEGCDGVEALQVAAAHVGAIRLLLTDVVMPRMGGGELAQRLTALRPEVRVLFMSGYTDDDVVRHGVRSRGAAFLQKPFSLDTLERRVREVLDGPTARHSDTALPPAA